MCVQNIIIYVLDTLNDDPKIIERMTYDKEEFLSLLEQRFELGQPNVDMLKDDKNWKQFVPHEYSGPCYTYQPPFESDPGYDISMYMKMNSNDFDEKLQIFLHEQNKFFYSTTSGADTIYLDHNTLKETKMSHPRAIRKTF